MRSSTGCWRTAQVSGLMGPVAQKRGFEEEIRLDTALFSMSIEHASRRIRSSSTPLVYDLFTPWHGRIQRSTLDRWTMTSLPRPAPSSLRAMVLRRQATRREDAGDAERAATSLKLRHPTRRTNDCSLLGRPPTALTPATPQSGRFEDFRAALCEV